MGYCSLALHTATEGALVSSILESGSVCTLTYHPSSDDSHCEGCVVSQKAFLIGRNAT